LTVSGGKCASAAILTNVAQTPLLAVDAAKALVGNSLDKTRSTPRRRLRWRSPILRRYARAKNAPVRAM
jgi:hypothetical protein